MDLKSLQRMTVPKLREEAMKLPDVSGVRGISKGELIQAIAKAHGIDLSGSHHGGSDRAELKKQIRELRSQIAQAIAAKGDVDLKKIRRRVKRLKARTRRLAKGASTLGPAPAQGAESPPPTS
jgi:NAD(P)H-dependent flavin oxidoreductase YrpB (nitropropane dioxygenase family)